MEIKKNSDIIKSLFKIKSVEKRIQPILYQIKRLKCSKETMSIQNSCLSMYQDANSLVHQSSGFIKALYFNSSINASSKNFLLNSLILPGYKKFIELKQNLNLLEVDDIYKESLDNLLKEIGEINLVLSDIINEINLILSI